MVAQRRSLFYTMFLAYIATGIITILPGPALAVIASHTHVTLDIAGWLFTTSSLGFSCGVILAGWLSARLNGTYILMMGMTLMGLMASMLPWTHSFPLLLIASFALGIGFSFVDVSINILVTLAFRDTLGESLNYLHSAFAIGALIGPLLLSFFLATLHGAFWSFGIGTMLALLTALLLALRRAPVLAQHVATTTSERMTRSTFLRTFAQVALWLMMLQMFLYVGAEVSFGDWVATAVSQGARVSLVIAAPAVTMFWLGLTAGRLLGGQLLKRGVLSEVRLLYGCITGGGFSCLVVAFFAHSIEIAFGMSLLAGLFFGPIFPSIMAIASRRFVHILSIVSSVLLFGAGTSGIVIPLFVGILITHVGISWGMAVPALACLLIFVPFALALSRRFSPVPILQSSDETHTMKQEPSSHAHI
jgi:fucose permease